MSESSTTSTPDLYPLVYTYINSYIQENQGEIAWKAHNDGKGYEGRQPIDSIEWKLVSSFDKKIYLMLLEGVLEDFANYVTSIEVEGMPEETPESNA